MEFTIVEFTLSKDVEVVAKRWITKDGKCWWPNGRKLTNLQRIIKKCEEPTEANFTLYPARVFKHYNSYDAARKDLPRALEDSDLNSETEEITRFRTRVPKATIIPNHSSDEEDERPTNKSKSYVPEMPPPPAPPATLSSTPTSSNAAKNVNVKRQLFRKPVTEPEQILSAERPSHVLSLVTLDPDPVQNSVDVEHVNNGLSDTFSETLPSAGQDVTNEQQDSSGKPANFEQWMVRNIILIKSQLNQLQESVDILVRGQQLSSGGPAQPVQIEDDLFQNLPIKTEAELDKLTQLVADEGKRKQLVFKISLRSGHTLSECVRRSISGLLADNIARLFNWKGSRGEKRGFNSSPLLSVIYESVRKNKKHVAADEKDMEVIIKEWLKNANKRTQSKMKKTATLEDQDEEESDTKSS